MMAKEAAAVSLADTLQGFSENGFFMQRSLKYSHVRSEFIQKISGLHSDDTSRSFSRRRFISDDKNEILLSPFSAQIGLPSLTDSL